MVFQKELLWNIIRSPDFQVELLLLRKYIGFQPMYYWVLDSHAV